MCTLMHRSQRLTSAGVSAVRYLSNLKTGFLVDSETN